MFRTLGKIFVPNPSFDETFRTWNFIPFLVKDSNPCLGPWLIGKYSIILASHKTIDVCGKLWSVQTGMDNKILFGNFQGPYCRWETWRTVRLNPGLPISDAQSILPPAESLPPSSHLSYFVTFSGFVWARVKLGNVKLWMHPSLMIGCQLHQDTTAIFHFFLLVFGQGKVGEFQIQKFPRTLCFAHPEGSRNPAYEWHILTR